MKITPLRVCYLVLIATVFAISGCGKKPDIKPIDPERLLHSFDAISSNHFSSNGVMVQQWSPLLGTWDPVMYVYGFNDNLEGALLTILFLEPYLKKTNHKERKLRAVLSKETFEKSELPDTATFPLMSEGKIALAEYEGGFFTNVLSHNKELNMFGWGWLALALLAGAAIGINQRSGDSNTPQAPATIDNSDVKPEVTNKPERGQNIETDIIISHKEAKSGASKQISIPRGGDGRVGNYTVKIPKGITEGQKIRLSGIGKAGSNGGEPGDLYLRVLLEQPPVTSFTFYDEYNQHIEPRWGKGEAKTTPIVILHWDDQDTSDKTLYVENSAEKDGIHIQNNWGELVTIQAQQHGNTWKLLCSRISQSPLSPFDVQLSMGKSKAKLKISAG